VTPVTPVTLKQNLRTTHRKKKTKKIKQKKMHKRRSWSGLGLKN
jgi:hypothetical protein